MKSGESYSIFRAGAARIGIDPEDPVWLAGFGTRDIPSEGVFSHIYARALALEDVDGIFSVLLSLDQFGLNRTSVELIADEIGRQFGIERHRLVIASSHSHSTPVCDKGLSLIYPMGAQDWQKAEAYGDMLRERAVEVVGLAIESMVPARLHYGRGAAGFGVNRRHQRPEGERWPGPVDPDVPVLRVTKEDGAVAALVFGYACHTTTLLSNKVSGDYAGFAEERLEKLYPGAVCLYVAGCGADINPLPRFSDELAISYGQILAAAVQQVANGEMSELTNHVQATREEVVLPFDKLPSIDELSRIAEEEPSIMSEWAKYWLSHVENQELVPDSIVYPIHVWSFGSQFAWVFLASEVCVDYSLRLKSVFGSTATWVSAYTSEMLGYVPSERLLREGGYEAEGSKAVYCLPAPFSTGVERRIVESVQCQIGSSRGEA